MVTAPTGTTQAAVDRAELLVALHLGLESLEPRTVTETGVARGSVLTLPRPASRLDAVILGGTDVTAIAQLATPTAVRLPVPVVGPYEVEYRVGWAAEKLPAAIRQAVLLTAEAGASLAGMPSGVSSVRLPEISVTFAGKGNQAGALPDSAVALLRPWRGVRW